MAQAACENSDLFFHISDICADRRVIHYFQSKILHAHAAEFETVHAQLIQVYLGLNVPLHCDLFEPTSDMMMKQFREALIEKEKL